MSTTRFSGPYSTTMTDILVHHNTLAGPASRVKAASHVLVRRPTMSQGRALETLGHAIEYLVDSRAYPILEAPSRAEREAGEILMRLSRQVFSDCREVVPVSRRLWLWLNRTGPHAGTTPDVLGDSRA